MFDGRRQNSAGGRVASASKGSELAGQSVPARHHVTHIPPVDRAIWRQRSASHSCAEEKLEHMEGVQIIGRCEQLQERKLALFVSDASGTVSSEEFGELLSSVRRAVGAKASGETDQVDDFRSGSVVCAPQADGDLPTTVYVFQNVDHARAAYAKRVASSGEASA